MAKVGKILLAVVQIGSIIALNSFAPGIAGALSGALGFHVSAFTVTAIGSVLISLAGSMLTNALFRPKSDMSASKINTRIEQANRVINGGKVLQGGQAAFGEFDAQGNLWVLIVHCDSILTGPPVYYLDNVAVSTNAQGEVNTADFMDDGKRYFQLWTHTYSEANPIPSGATELQAVFGSKWSTVEHLLVGTTYSVMRCRAIKLENRYKVYRWRGAFGLGEPNLAVLGTWSNMYDPRDPTQVLGDRTTYKPSRNAAIAWAWWRTHRYGRRKPESEINWDRVAEQADICDQQVTGIESTQPRYTCDISATDNVDRGAIEQQIMMACDGQIVFDDDGRSWMRVGYYYTPTLALSRNRDIITMETVEAQDGESETQGVVVRYIDPLAGYTLQAAAAWYNPNYYRPGEGNTFLTIDIPTISNHNQAMRVAKGHGMRSQPIQKIAPTVGLRGLRAMDERIVRINYDNTFAGDYEIATPVEVDESGMFCSLGGVPVDPDRWDLLAGEEKPRPNSASSYVEIPLVLPTGVVVAYNNGRLEATFDAAVRADVRYEFEYIAQKDQATGQWSRMSTDMDAQFAYSGPVDQTEPQLVRWRTVSSGGAVTLWSDPPYLVGAQQPVLKSATNLSASAGVVQWKNPNDLRFFYSDVYRGATATFSAATRIIQGMQGGVGQPQSIDDVAPVGTYYWVVSHAEDGTAAAPTGPAIST